MKNISASATDVTYRNKAGNFSKTKVTLYDLNGKKLAPGKDYSKQFEYYDVTEYFATNSSGNIMISYSDELVQEIAKADQGLSQTVAILDPKNDIPSSNRVICVKVDALDTDQCNYSGTAYAFYRISEYDISKCSVKIAKEFVYNGSAQTIEPDDLNVTLGSGKNQQTLVYGQDYLVDVQSYSNNVKTGMASVKIYGTGKYCGVKKITFRIAGKKMSL